MSGHNDDDSYTSSFSSVLRNDDPKKDGVNGPDSLTILQSMICPRTYASQRRMRYAAFAAGFAAAFGLSGILMGLSEGQGQSGGGGSVNREGGVGAGLGVRAAMSSSSAAALVVVDFPPFGYEGRSVPPDEWTVRSSEDGLRTMYQSGRTLTVSTWNIAAINNNPFEYWITYPEDPEYDRIMGAIERFIEDPGKQDVPVNLVFTDGMFDRLEQRMDGIGWDSDHKVRRYWETDFKHRRIVSEFLKDPVLGSKRLASMPDRVTNTIHVDGMDEPVCRPTVINAYDGDLSSVMNWWPQWEAFMFDIPLTVGGKTSPVYAMLRPIKKSKYPDVTEEEEKISLALQMMCGAIFDAILVRMMNAVSEPDKWQNLKRTMVQNLIKRKVPRTLEILQSSYATSDVVALQEVSVSFIEQATASPIALTHHVVGPAVPDAVRDQNSVLLLRRDVFPDGPVRDITDLVVNAFPEGEDVPVANGDLLAIDVRDRDGVPYVLASFHGDTNGLATKPVLDALVKAVSSDPSLAGHQLVFGMDANAYERAKPGKQLDVMDLGRRHVEHGLTSAWGDVPQPSNYTTFNARTYLQPQLNKACKSDQKREKGDVNPKDFILFRKDGLEVAWTWKDNTGSGWMSPGDQGKSYVEDMAFPTLGFPSDHGILSTALRPVARFGSVQASS